MKVKKSKVIISIKNKSKKIKSKPKNDFTLQKLKS